MQNLLHLTNNEILHFTKKNQHPTPLTKQNKLISNARTQPFATLVRRLGLLFGYLFPLLHALYVGKFPVDVLEMLKCAENWPI